MTAFQKPHATKGALKLGLYGPAGSGKTFTSLLLAEGLAQHTGKRIAFVDTEHGTDFYAQAVSQRAVHPEAFDFDCLYSRSITEVLASLRGLDQVSHGVVVVDSISHLWDACKAAYTGKLTKKGGIPLPAWAAIKKPYRELLNLLLAMPRHVILCGRQAVEYGEDEETGELKALGVKMRAEGETAYEPDVLLRMEARRTGKSKAVVPVAHVEKDRSGVLAGQAIALPTFDKIARPLLGLLGSTHSVLPSEEEVGLQDAEALARQEQEASAGLAAAYNARIAQAATMAELEAIGREMTPPIKQRLLAPDLDRIRRGYGERQASLKLHNGQAAVV